MDHLALIERAQAGEHAAFDALYRSAYAPVYRFVLIRVKSKDVAEDITQDVFIKFLKALPTYVGSPSILPFLFTAARNTIIDHYRKRKPDYDDEALWALASEDPSPEETAALGAEVTMVLKLLSQLSPAEEAAIKLRYLDGLSTVEVAAILEKSEEAVRQILSRGVRGIRSLLEGSTS